MSRLETERLILREFEPSDRDAFIAMNACPEAMRYFPAVLTPKESDEALERVAKLFAEYGFGFYANELKETGEFVGFLGLKYLPDNVPLRRSLEIGWRYDKKFWGRGLAPEAARECLRYAFEVVDAPEVVAITTASNEASRRVMEKIGMSYDPESDFDHPDVPDGPMKRHVAYWIKKSDWQNYA